MSIPEACIKAASTALDKENARLHPELPNFGERRARRVILALAENMPEDAVEKASFAICQSGKFECGQGRCAPICMEAMGHKPKECSHALHVHGVLARAAILAALMDIVEGE